MSKQEKNLILRGANYSLKRRVPVRYQAVERREIIWISLHTDSLTRAREKAQEVWKAQIAAWEAKLAGKTEDANQLFEAVQQLAHSKGVTYLPVGQVVDLPIGELLDRIEAIGAPSGLPAIEDAQAMLGTVSAPKLLLSEALEAFWELSQDKVLKKSPDQLRRWRNPRIKAVKNFIQVIDDKPINEITREDMLNFRKWWIIKVAVEGRNPSTANKDFIHLSKVLKTVNELKQLGLDLPVAGLSLKEGKRKSRPPFSDSWIKDKLLAPSALAELEPQARAIFLTMVNTGARPSELANLMPTHIFLDHEFPHIVVTADERDEDRELKSDNAERNIPLVGVSLEAMRNFPQGFPLYHDNPSLSDITNSYLTKHGLRETPKHVAYSLRHSFESRLRRSAIDERIRSELFGHSYFRERYGAPELDELTEALQSIAF